MVLRLPAGTALAEDQGLFPSNHVIACKSNSNGVDLMPSWPQKAVHSCAQTYAQAHTCSHNLQVKMNHLKKEVRSRSALWLVLDRGGPCCLPSVSEKTDRLGERTQCGQASYHSDMSPAMKTRVCCLGGAGSQNCVLR